MNLNDPAAPSAVRHPRAIVKIGGTTFNSDGTPNVTGAPLDMPGWTEWSVENNAFYQADRFEVSFAVGALPPNRDLAWFTSQQEISVEIFAGFPADPENFGPGDLKSWIYGLADEIEYDPVARLIKLHGRDLTAKMIDTKTTQVYVNRVASDIATMLANKYGLTPVVTQTSVMSGKFYELVHAHIHSARSEWDLLTFLAQQEQFSVYVVGRELHFEPVPSVNTTPYVLQWKEPDVDSPASFNGMDIRFHRGLVLAKGAQVTVQSFNQRGKNIIAKYPKSAGSNAQQYVYRFANLDAEKALQKAQALYREIVRHEVNVSASLPGDNDLTTRVLLKVSGTGTAYDQIYYPAKVHRSMSYGGGYRMEVEAKNQSPQTQVTI